MFSKLFGRKKETVVTGQPISDWSFLGTDIHSHFVPGIDDGAQTVEDSVNLIRQMQDMGYRSIVTTPHIKYDHFPNTRNTILTGLQQLHHALEEQGITIPVKAAAEYYIDDHFMHLLDSEPLLTITGNEVLVEMSFMFEPVRFSEIIFKIQTAGYKPILAHPERYAFYHSRPEVYRELKDRGCHLQLNVIALAGYYGKSVKHIAEQLLKERLYDYCGTDMHHLKHAEVMQKMRHSSVMQSLVSYPFLNASI